MKTLYYLQVDKNILGVSQKYTKGFLYFVFTDISDVQRFSRTNKALCKFTEITPICIEPTLEGIKKLPVKDESKVRIAIPQKGGFSFSTWSDYLMTLG